MHKLATLGVVTALTATLAAVPAQSAFSWQDKPAVAQSKSAWSGVKWDGSVVEVVNKLPSDWNGAVNSAVNWIDKFTASDMRLVKSCHTGVRRCIVIRNARLKGDSKRNNAAGWSKGSTITIDVWKINNKKPWKGRFKYASKRQLIAHELGHQRFLGHTKRCDNFMNQYFKCNGHTPYVWTNAAQRKHLAKY